MPRIIYKTSYGHRVPSTTTITGLLNKPFLVRWANKLGLKGIDSTKYVDNLADIGTLAHQMAMDYMLGVETDISQYTAEQVDRAENCFLSFLEWVKNQELKPIILEQSMVSEENLYGGTVDCYCLLNGKKTLIDFKTGKAIYDDYFLQVSAYSALLKENGHEVEEAYILRIGRDETEGFEFKKVKNRDRYYEIFNHLNQIYKLKKIVNWR